jgi:hypothetical protein
MEPTCTQLDVRYCDIIMRKSEGAHDHLKPPAPVATAGFDAASPVAIMLSMYRNSAEVGVGKPWQSVES